MSQWSVDDLTRIGNAEEVHISSLSREGAHRKPVTTWIVRQGDDLYVRSVRGRRGHWFRGVQERREGRIRAGGVQRDVSFVEADDDLDNEIDDAYRTKYRKYAGRILDSVLTLDARSATLKLVPSSAS